jgi:hypothetical protein
VKMKTSEIVEFLKDYIDESGMEIKEIELPKKGEDELSLHQIKADPILFGELFLVFYNEFRKNFKECGNKEINNLLMKYQGYALRLVELSSYKFRSIDYGKGMAQRVLIGYIQERYFELQDFFDICAGVYLE